MNRAFLAILLTVATLAGCASSQSSRVYSRDQAMTSWDVDYGAVKQIQDVKIEGDRRTLGRVGGGFIGYEMGRAVGNGSGSRIAGAVGAVIGAVSGDTVEKHITTIDGYEITIELETGNEAIAIVQAADERFALGERVKVLRRADGAARVTKV